MAVCMDLVRSEFPAIDEDLCRYIEDVLENGKEDFENGEEIYEAIGAVMHEVGGNSKSEEEIMSLCENLLDTLKMERKICNGPTKVLNAPVHLGSMAATLESKVDEIKSIWVTQREDTLKVDQKKLEKAEAKLQQKQERRNKDSKPSISVSKENAASATQVLSKKDMKMDAKGTNNSKNIKIENFDVSFGDRVLLKGADLTLVFGKRYGLCGRNGLGKTTLLRMISSGQLRIPSHISILHVEQEVVGDETCALQSVLESDTVRENLLKEERELSSKVNERNHGSQVSTRLAEVYAELQHIEADKAPARASVILAGLGFDSRRQKQPTKVFSGGWRMRLSLARALFSRPDLLLLDEPTNMLDMKAIIWLETYLQNWPTTLLVVSHDRHFLDTVPNEILHLHSQRIDCYRGNYDNFVKAKAEKLKNQQREYEAQQQYRAHVQEFIDKFRYNAKRASLVQSKIKLLEKLPELKAVEEESGVILKFPATEPLSPPILQLDEVSFAYEEGRPVLVNINLSATLESRICIVGENGSGKTTLLKILMEELTPQSGIRNAHRNLKFGYFSQHHVDQLEMEIASLEFLQIRFPGKRVEEYRRQLGSFGVSGDLALQKINSLSGGQKSRVAFAVMSMTKPNFLILDEPTNHLDIESIEALGKAINTFNGGVILVSHDERLIRMVCQELWVCGGGKVCSMEGGFDEYRRIIEKELLDAQSK